MCNHRNYSARNVVAPRPEEVTGRQIWAEVPVPDRVFSFMKL